MSFNTFMSPYQQPGVPTPVSRLVGAISGGRFYVTVVQSPRNTSLTSHPTSRPRSHQEEEKQSCEYKSKKATVWPRYPETTSCQRCSLGSSQSKLKVQIEMKCQVKETLKQCLTHLPCLLYTPRGNQATDESEPRCLTSSGWTKFGNTIYAIYIEDNVTVLKVSLNIVKDLCQIDLTPIRNFKYCFTIENK